MLLLNYWWFSSWYRLKSYKIFLLNRVFFIDSNRLLVLASTVERRLSGLFGTRLRTDTRITRIRNESIYLFNHKFLICFWNLYYVLLKPSQFLFPSCFYVENIWNVPWFITFFVLKMCSVNLFFFKYPLQHAMSSLYWTVNFKQHG